MLFILGTTIFFTIILRLILPHMPEGYETEWQPSKLEKWLKNKENS